MPTLEDFKAKYAPVFALMEKGGVRLDHLHVKDDKLVMTGAAANEDVRNAVWSAVKAVDPIYSDTNIEIAIDGSLPAPPPEAKKYTVAAGDSLWRIAEKELGNGARYKELLGVNPQLKDEHSVIHPGDVLNIPHK